MEQICTRIIQLFSMHDIPTFCCHTIFFFKTISYNIMNLFSKSHICFKTGALIFHLKPQAIQIPKRKIFSPCLLSCFCFACFCFEGPQGRVRADNRQFTFWTGNLKLKSHRKDKPELGLVDLKVKSVPALSFISIMEPQPRKSDQVTNYFVWNMHKCAPMFLVVNTRNSIIKYFLTGT